MNKKNKKSEEPKIYAANNKKGSISRKEFIGAVGALTAGAAILPTNTFAEKIKSTDSNTKAFKAHKGSITSISYSPDGKILASGSEDNTIKLWSMPEGKLIKVLKGHYKYVSSMCFSPDGKILISGGADKKINFWEVSDGKLLKSLSEHKESIKSISISPDGNMLASSGADQISNFWSIPKLSSLISGDQSISKLRTWRNFRFLEPNINKEWNISEDIIVRVGNFKIQIINTSGKLIKKRLMYWRDKTICISPDNKYIAIGSLGPVYVYELPNLKRVAKIKSLSSVDSIVISQKNKMMVSSIGTQIIVTGFPKEGKKKFVTDDSDIIKSLYFSEDEKFLFSENDLGIKKWTVKNGTLTSPVEFQTKLIEAVSFNPNGEMIATVGDNGSVKIYSRSDGKLIKTLKGDYDSINSVCFSPDGTMLAFVSNGNAISSWSIPEGNLLHTLMETTSDINSICFSPDGKIMASGGLNKTIYLWSLPDGKLLKILDGHKNSVNSVSISPDGKILVSGSSDNTIKLWTLPDGEPCFSLFDPALTEKTKTMEIKQMGPATETVPCGTPIPPGATCICNCVASSITYPGTEMICTCNTITVPVGTSLYGNYTCVCNTIVVGTVCSCDSVCTCDSVCSCNNHRSTYTYYTTYWHPN